MSTIKAFSLSFWTAVVIIVALNTIIFSLLIMTFVDDLKVQYIPDNAYYYLTLSRNFSSLGIWTFDSGISVTSGFHLLFAYLLSSLFLLLALAAAQFPSLFLGDVLLTPEEMDGLMAGLLVSSEPPRCETHLENWLAENKESVGNRYASELAGHYR